MTRTDEEILKIAAEHNVGDLTLGYTLKTRNNAKALVNVESLPNNILPERVVNRSYPEQNYSFVWCPLDDSPYSRKYVADCKADGYEVVTEKEWIVNHASWDWHKPENWRYRWSVSKLLLNPYDEFLMYRNEDKWAAMQAKREALNNDSIKARTEAAVEQARGTLHNRGMAGVEVEA